MKTKKYKIVIEQEVYNKKSGTKITKHTLLKDSTYDECKAFIKLNYNVELNGFELIVPGFLYPSRIKIK